jgi:hypothetical protein
MYSRDIIKLWRVQNTVRCPLLVTHQQIHGYFRCTLPPSPFHRRSADYLQHHSECLVTLVAFWDDYHSNG